MPLTMIVNSSDSVMAGDKGPDGERGFGLAHEDAGGDVQGFGAARAHDALHDDGENLHDLLHDPEVVKDGKKRSDEDDDGQDAEREDRSQRSARPAEGVAEDKRTAFLGIGQHGGHGDARRPEQLTEIGLEYEDRESELKSETPEDQAQFNGALVMREEPGGQQDGGDPE